jgi:hypothetical protein
VEAELEFLEVHGGGGSGREESNCAISCYDSLTERIKLIRIIVPDMRVRGQLTCLEVKKQTKKKDCKL